MSTQIDRTPEIRARCLIPKFLEISIFIRTLARDFRPNSIRTLPQASKKVGFYPQNPQINCHFRPIFSGLRHPHFSRARLAQNDPKFGVFIRTLPQGSHRKWSIFIRIGLRPVQILAQILSAQGSGIWRGFQGSCVRATGAAWPTRDRRNPESM